MVKNQIASMAESYLLNEISILQPTRMEASFLSEKSVTWRRPCTFVVSGGSPTSNRQGAAPLAFDWL